MGGGQALEGAFGVVEEDPWVVAVVEGEDAVGIGGEVGESVVAESQFFVKWKCPYERMCAVAHVESRSEVLDGGGTATHSRPGFQDEGVDPRSGQIGRAQQPVVAASDHDHLGIGGQGESNL